MVEVKGKLGRIVYMDGKGEMGFDYLGSDLYVSDPDQVELLAPLTEVGYQEDADIFMEGVELDEEDRETALDWVRSRLKFYYGTVRQANEGRKRKNMIRLVPEIPDRFVRYGRELWVKDRADFEMLKPLLRTEDFTKFVDVLEHGCLSHDEYLVLYDWAKIVTNDYRALYACAKARIWTDTVHPVEALDLLPEIPDSKFLATVYSMNNSSYLSVYLAGVLDTLALSSPDRDHWRWVLDSAVDAAAQLNEDQEKVREMVNRVLDGVKK